MAYIIKNTSGLINTRLTDVGRRKLSQGSFNISYFQIGDSEVSYMQNPKFIQTNNNILMPAFNAQNDVGVPESNKQNVKYPYYLAGFDGNTYGIPFMDSSIQQVYNSAGSKGFFVGETGSWSAETSSAYTISSNYRLDMSTLTGGTSITLDIDFCSATSGTPSVNDFVIIYYDGNGGCGDVSTSAVLTYKIQDIDPATGTTGTTFTLTLDRPTPTFPAGDARVLIYPSGSTVLYDTITPEPFWDTDTINFESPCDVSKRENTPIWNMNIPWSVNPAGLFSNTYENYINYGSITYLGTKEYLGYQNTSGQTDTSEVFHYNSFDEKVVVPPNEQKTIAIIHYTNQSIDNVYGEKFATIPFDPQNPTDQTGLARNFKLSIPTLMWHKSTGNTMGETFMIDPPDYDLCIPYYIRSSKNADMNDPGIRYYHLWDLNPDDNDNLNRIGKVFPDQQIVVIDDEEVVAALSYKSNRNWTLPAPKLTLIPPNICDPGVTTTGIMTGDTQVMWITYRFDSTGFTDSLHCNYYSKIVGPSTGCTDTTQNVAVRFGVEFPYLIQSGLSGFTATNLKLLCQLIEGNDLPSPTEWREIDVTNLLSGTTIGGYITEAGLTGTTFQIDFDNYDSAPIYNLSNYLDLPTINETDVLNFGDEYFFYGNIETDISATIYEMRYLINLNENQFVNSSNPTWLSGSTSYFTEIGLFDSNKDLMVISKMQSPQIRQGIQQVVVKLDF
jgi:hypothetical protein